MPWQGVLGGDEGMEGGGEGGGRGNGTSGSVSCGRHSTVPVVCFLPIEQRAKARQGKARQQSPSLLVRFYVTDDVFGQSERVIWCSPERRSSGKYSVHLLTFMIYEQFYARARVCCAVGVYGVRYISSTSKQRYSRLLCLSASMNSRACVCSPLCVSS